MNIQEHQICHGLYNEGPTEKNQIVLSATNMCTDDFEEIIAQYKKSGRRMPHYIVKRDGVICCLIPESGWNKIDGIDKKTCRKIISIALCNAGPLKKVDNGYTSKNSYVMENNLFQVAYDFCCEETWRGENYFEPYGDNQLSSLKELLQDIVLRNGINYNYDSRLGDICPAAINGHDGIYFAGSYNKYGLDCYPHLGLIRLLKRI